MPKLCKCVYIQLMKKHFLKENLRLILFISNSNSPYILKTKSPIKLMTGDFYI
ncbi:hypothetical protein ACFP3I_04120 [Chryseobacterium arachidis]|uniref:hypothetical protein n=1 Tax=Chryseobacterium arachidis TaxID=1416778 RepID=UPI003612F96A